MAKLAIKGHHERGKEVIETLKDKLKDCDKEVLIDIIAEEGKTTLEITYRDTIPIDSVVVFKEEFKK